MITLAMFTINFFHPGFLLGHGDTWRAQMSSATVNETEERKMQKAEMA